MFILIYILHNFFLLKKLIAKNHAPIYRPDISIDECLLWEHTYWEAILYSQMENDVETVRRNDIFDDPYNNTNSWNNCVLVL